MRLIQRLGWLRSAILNRQGFVLVRWFDDNAFKEIAKKREGMSGKTIDEQ